MRLSNAGFTAEDHVIMCVLRCKSVQSNRFTGAKEGVMQQIFPAIVPSP
jgi:hypothetical protein